jgi:hypothetical protein
MSKKVKLRDRILATIRENPRISRKQVLESVEPHERGAARKQLERLAKTNQITSLFQVAEQKRNLHKFLVFIATNPSAQTRRRYQRRGPNAPSYQEQICEYVRKATRETPEWSPIIVAGEEIVQGRADIILSLYGPSADLITEFTTKCIRIHDDVASTETARVVQFRRSPLEVAGERAAPK